MALVLRQPFAPKKMAKLITRSFSDRSRTCYGQIATSGKDARPEVRTVHLHYVPSVKTVMFNTNRCSDKVKHLHKDPWIAGCYFDSARNLQFRWKGPVTLVTDTKSSAERELLDEMWLLTSARTRAAYWLEYDGSEDISKRCPDCITVICRPTWWDILELHRTHYHKGKRTISQLRAGRWTTRSVSPLTGK